MKNILILLFGCFISFASIAQSADETAARACLQDYMSGDGYRMEKAFHPGATMKYINPKTGELVDVPIADFIARVKASSSKEERNIEIVSLNIEGTAANAKIKIDAATAILYDYMNMLKINGEWKIVSKIFSREAK